MTLTRRVVGAGATYLFVALMTLSGVLYLIGPPSIVAAIRALGYPRYLLAILGAAKLLGAAALATRRARKLREWAYAGFTFDLVGAIASHVASDDARHALPPLVALAILATSYVATSRSSAPPGLFSGDPTMQPQSRWPMWLGRVVLAGTTMLFLRIGLGFVVDPVGAVAPHAITLGSAEAITMMRVTGALFVAIALVLVACNVAKRRVVAGLAFLAAIATTVLAVRVAGVVVDGPAPFTMHVLGPEIALVLFSGTALLLLRIQPTRSP